MADFLDRLTLLIAADSSGAVNIIKGFGSTTQSELQKVEAGAAASGKRAGGVFAQGMQSEALLAVAGLQAAVGGIGLTLFAKSSLQDAVALERANAALAAGIKATGGAAGATEGSIDRLAQSLQKTDAIFSGNIKQSAGLLLAFREVRNEAGAGNDVFNRTVAVSAALSNFFGRDLTSVTIQLGRALENPQAGMQALSRSGVTLSQSLRQTILHFAKQGDLLSAQKALLDELEKRYTTAGAAIAKADPFQQFGVSLKEFKTSVGEDLLPAASQILHFASDVLGVFGHLPGPVRETTEALLAVGVAVVPLLKVKQVLDSLRAAGATSGAISAGGAAASEASVAVSTNGQAAAAERATVATAGLNEQLSLLGPEAEAAAVGETTLAATLDEEAVAAETATAANTALSLSLGAVVGGLAAGVGSFALASSLLNQFFGGHHTDFKTLTGDIDRLGASIRNVAEDSAWEKLIHLPSVKQNIKDIQDANAGLVQVLDTKGADAAALAYGKLVNKLLATGVSLKDIASEFGPFLDALAESRSQSDATGDSVDSLTTRFHKFALSLDSFKANLSIADSFDAVQSAVDKLNQDKLDAVGLGDKSIAAAQAERDAQRQVVDANQGVSDSHQRLADSYIRLQDAQDRVKDSVEKLKDAQRDLDEYNSARGAHERALQLDIIQRRVVTTPAESDQKQLDLLRFADDNANKQQQLNDNVASSLKGVRDANRGVADAVRGVSDAERGVADATQRAADAQDKARQATEKRKKVQADAAKAAQDDERKVAEAILNTISTIDEAAQKTGVENDQLKLWDAYLDGLAKKYAPGSDLSKNITSFYDNLNAQHGSVAADTAYFHRWINAAPITETERNRLNAIVDGNFHGTVSAGERTVLHQLGVPGFASGGLVPGLRGVPTLAIVHGGERVLTAEQQAQGGGVVVNQTNHFGGDAPSSADLEYANRALGWRLSRLGRG